MKQILVLAISTLFVASLASLSACEEKKPAPASTSAPAADDHGHAHGPDGSHADEESSGHGHGGAVIQLGSATAGSFELKATRDEGPIVAGKDAPIDVTVTPAAGADAKAVAVRFWIGTQDAKGSVKAKAEIENPAEPNRWHTHAEIPNPLPEGSMIWVEIEDAAGKTAVASFGLATEG